MEERHCLWQPSTDHPLDALATDAPPCGFRRCPSRSVAAAATRPAAFRESGRLPRRVATAAASASGSPMSDRGTPTQNSRKGPSSLAEGRGA